MADYRTTLSVAPSVEENRTVLVMRFSAVGDIVLAAPALDALKHAWPAARIVVATKAAFAPLLESHPAVSEVIGRDDGEDTVSYVARLRAVRPDVVLDLHGKARSRILALLVNPSRIETWHGRGAMTSLLVRAGLRTWRAGSLFCDRYHEAVERVVGSRLPRGELRYHVATRDQAQADRVLVSSGIDPSRPLVGLCPGANWETKRWPVERYAALAARLVERGVQVMVAGSPPEARLCAQVASVHPAVVDLGGRLSLRELPGAIARCTAFVANDSGPMHMARALGVPTLAIFGSTDPGQFSFDGHAMLFADVPCSPCSLYGRARCPKGHFNCMKELDVDRAWQSLAPLLEGGRRSLLSA